MTGIFDGMASTLRDIFGEPVTIHPGGGAPVTITGILRQTPVEELDDTGAAIVTQTPMLTAAEADVAGLGPGDVIEQGGQRWTVSWREDAISPAADRNIAIKLELKE